MSGQRCEFLRGSLAGLVSRVGAAGIAFAFNVVLARELGADATGLFFVGVALASVLSVLARLGMDNAIVRHSAGLMAAGDWFSVRRVYLRCVGITLVAAALLTLPGIGLAGMLAEYFLGGADREDIATMFLLALIPFSLVQLHARFFQASHRIGTALFAQTALLPTFMLSLLLVVQAPLDLAAVSRGYLLSALLAAFICAALWQLYTRGQAGGSGRFRFAQLVRSSRYLYPTTVVEQIIQPWAAIIFLGWWASATETAWYATASRAAVIITFLIVPINAALSPRLSALWSQGRSADFLRLSGLAAIVMFGIGVPMAILVMLFSTPIMAIFGEDFRPAATVLVIIAAGQLFNVATGPVRSMLIMAGHESTYRYLCLIGGAANLLLCVVLIPTAGAVGAAVAATTSIAVNNSLAATFAWKKIYLPNRQTAPAGAEGS